MVSLFDILSPSSPMALAVPTSNGTVDSSSNGYSAHVETITPTLAAEILETMTYDRQRPVRQNHIQYLLQEMQRGTFKPGAIEIRVVGDRRYLIDGQHRLGAIVLSGQSFPMVLIEQRVNSLDEVAADYSRTDRGQGRSYDDTFRARDLTEIVGIAPSCLKYYSAAIGQILAGFSQHDVGVRSTTRSTDIRVEMMQAWAPQMQALQQAIPSDWSKVLRGRLRTGSTLGVALITMRYQPDAAMAFWPAVAANDKLAHGQPEQALVNFLLTTDAKDISRTLYSRVVASCWNAAFEGRKLTHAKRLTEWTTKPIAIKGTPYDGAKTILPYANVA